MSTKTFLNRNIWAQYNENRPKCSEDTERTQNIRVNPKILWMFSFFFFLGGGGGGGGHCKIGLYLGVIFMYVRVFSKGQ